MRRLISIMTVACAVSAPLVGQSPVPAGQSQGSGAKPPGGAPGGSASGRGHAGDHTNATPASTDAVFMRTAAMDGMAEVEHGRLAAQNAANDEVKQFGQRMVDDHSKAGDELKALASQKSVTLPTELDAKHKAMQDKLSKMKGAAFDRAYMGHMVTAHQQAVALFQKEAGGGKDGEVKAWAAKTLPTLQEHLKSARGTNTKVAGTAKTTAEGAR